MAMQVAELAPGLWRWTARHPDWKPEEDWEPEVGCVYWEGADATCLIDPLLPGDADDAERFWRHLDADVERVGRPVAVLLTLFWHERSAAEVARHYDAEVWAHEDALPRLELAVEHPFRAGDALPGGADAVEVPRTGEVVFVLPDGALVAGDVLIGDGAGGVRVCPDAWFRDPEGPAKARAALRPLLERPLELVVVSHGEPVTENAREALARALDG
jgi:glyoxylase-like metal-dependent hydrolase (beta-lactamase superfamily II)